MRLILKFLTFVISLIFCIISCNHVEHPSKPTIDPSSGNCPKYTHKDDASIGNVTSLPEGFFVFDRDTIPGLYKSLVLNYNASLIPNTEHDYPRTISISDDGKWVLYANGYSGILYLIQVNGCGKTIVPVTNTSGMYPTITDFTGEVPVSVKYSISPAGGRFTQYVQTFHQTSLFQRRSDHCRYW